jgi:hypothetical protein
VNPDTKAFPALSTAIPFPKSPSLPPIRKLNGEILSVPPKAFELLTLRKGCKDALDALLPLVCSAQALCKAMSFYQSLN